MPNRFRRACGTATNQALTFTPALTTPRNQTIGGRAYFPRWQALLAAIPSLTARQRGTGVHPLILITYCFVVYRKAEFSSRDLLGPLVGVVEVSEMAEHRWQP